MSESTQTQDRSKLIEAMITAAEDFYRFGWLSATSGNMSCRLDDETVVITSSDCHLRAPTPQDFVDIDLDGSPKSDEAPAVDAGLHAALYRHLDHAGAVYHIHHVEAALCSDRDDTRGFTHFHELTMLHALGIEADGSEPELNIPVVDAPYDEDERIKAVTDELTDGDAPEAPCLNVKNHGLYVWGETPQQARRYVEACAYLFQYSWQRPMNPKESSSISGFEM